MGDTVNLDDRNAEYMSTIANLKADLAKLIELGWHSVGDVEATYSEAVAALETVVRFNQHVLNRNHENMMRRFDAEERRVAHLRDIAQVRDI